MSRYHVRMSFYDRSDNSAELTISIMARSVEEAVAEAKRWLRDNAPYFKVKSVEEV